ncbi:MAG: AMP-dependent synthetase/ligase [Promethearchaeota archaeon]
MKFKKLEFKRYNSIPELFNETVAKFPNKTAFKFYEDNNINGKIMQLTFKEYKDRVDKAAAGLLAYGFKPKDHLAILSETRYEWCIADIAILSIGGVTVTIFPTLAEQQVRFIITDSDSIGLFLSNRKQLEKVLDTWEDRLPELQLVIVFEESALEGLLDLVKKYITESKATEYMNKIISLNQLYKKGEEYLSNNPDAVSSIISQIKEDDLASIIYTSGTTGIPKGVMLSHKNFLSDVIMGAISVHPDPNEVSVTYLPLSHSFTRTVEHFGMILYGATLCFCPDPHQLAKAMLDFRPTSVIGVPYVFETIYQMIRAEIAKQSPKVQKIFWNAISVGKKIAETIEQGKKPSIKLKIKFAIVKKLILSQVKKRFGGRIRHFLSGSAPLNPETAKFFYALGIPVYEGYGLTEAAPVTHTNVDEQVSNTYPPFKFGKVGPIIGYDKFGSTHPYEPMEHRLSEIGELLISGPNIMLGYYKRPEETKEALEEIDEKIWLHTGDLAEIDEDGYVKITGRAKEIIVLKTGKKVAPNLIEAIYEEHPYIKQVMLLGEGEKFIAALIAPNIEYKEEICKKIGVDPNITDEEFLQNKKIYNYFKDLIEEIQKGRVSHYESIKKFALVKEFTEEDGLLSPTLKLKRKKIYEKYFDLIRKMYHDDKNLEKKNETKE